MIMDHYGIINKYADLKFRNQKKRDKFVASLVAFLNRDAPEKEKKRLIEALWDEIRGS